MFEVRNITPGVKLPAVAGYSEAIDAAVEERIVPFRRRGQTDGMVKQRGKRPAVCNDKYGLPTMASADFFGPLPASQMSLGDTFTLGYNIVWVTAEKSFRLCRVFRSKLSYRQPLCDTKIALP